MPKTSFRNSEENGAASDAVGRAHLNAAVRALEYAWSELEGDPIGQARLQNAIREFITTVLEAALRDKDKDNKGQA